MSLVATQMPGRGLSFLLTLTAVLAGCGGGSSGGGGNHLPPPTTEMLYASGWSQVAALSINTSTGALTQTAAVPESNNTVGIVATPSANFLYVSGNSNGIVGFTIGQNGTLSQMNGSPWPGSPGYSGPGLAMDAAGKFIYAAIGGAVAGFAVNSTTGALTAMAGSPFTSGIGPFQPVVDPTGNFLYVSDSVDPQGGIYAFGINPSTGVLTPIQGSPFPTLPDAEPEGLVTDPTGKFLYASLFAEDGIAAFTIDGASGALASVAGSPFSTGAESGPASHLWSITMDLSGKRLYALSSTASGSVVSAFTIDSTSGALTPVNGSPFAALSSTMSGGLAVDPSGKFLYVAGGNVGYIVPMSIDGATGALTALPVFSLGGNIPTNLTIATLP
jgi:6-phosphogluconolactonase